MFQLLELTIFCPVFSLTLGFVHQGVAFPLLWWMLDFLKAAIENLLNAEP
jgi:hypothetical protein